MSFAQSLFKNPAAILVGALVLIVAVGCGEPEKLPPDKIIGKAVPAIQAANSFHFTLETSKVQKPMPGIFITKADGDVVKPDKLSGNVSATVGGVAVSIRVVVDGKSQYMTDPFTGVWSPMSPSFNVVSFFDPSKGVSDILSNVKGLASDGTENIDGTDTYRLKGTVPTSALKSLSSEVTATADLTSTLWIGAGDFLLRRVRLEGALLADEPADIVRTITVKDYNKAVKIETPVVK